MEVCNLTFFHLCLGQVEKRKKSTDKTLQTKIPEKEQFKNNNEEIEFSIYHFCKKKKKDRSQYTVQCVMLVLLSPNSQEIPRTGVSTVARTYKKRKGQERLPLCDRLSRPYHCNSCSCSLPPHPLCLTSHPQWMTDRCLLHVHDFRQPFLRYFDQELLSPGHHYGQLTMPNFNTTLPSAVI